MKDFLSHCNPLGKPPKYKDPRELWGKFLEYVDWVEAHPIELPQRMSGYGTKTEIKTQSQQQGKVSRPLSLFAWCLWANIANWTDFKKAECRHRGDYPTIIRAIENAIKSQQVDGAMVGIYNHNLTARLNGISDNMELTGPGGSDLMKPIKVVFDGAVKANLNTNGDPKSVKVMDEDEFEKED